MSNFAFLPERFRDIATPAIQSEAQIINDPRAACFHARFSLEAIVHWLYRHDRSLRMPYDKALGTLLHEPSFQNLLPEAIFQKARVIQKVGNVAVHDPRPIKGEHAHQLVKELHHICFWLMRTYAPSASKEGAGWKDDRVPKPLSQGSVAPRAELEALETKLAEQNEEMLKQQLERDSLNDELQELKKQLAEVRAKQVEIPDTHDYTEDETRRYLIDVDLLRAGWPLDQPQDREYEVVGMPNDKGVGYVDYVLWGADGKPLAVVEAKRTTVDPEVGQQQAKLYADCLEQMHGQRPIIFYTNGYVNWIWDDKAYPPRRIAGFYKRDELEALIHGRERRQPLSVSSIKDEIVERYYQKRAIGSIFEQLTKARRKALLVMATGTGKTRTAIALTDVLQRAGWAKRVLFLADRRSLVKQAANAYKAHLPESSPVNLVTDKDGQGRVYTCTYPTMMGLIDETSGDVVKYGVGHFDLIIIDEAHRSVYQKYGAIFDYFDSVLVGLTATPSEEVDKNTYDLFELEQGVPTDAYELEKAVQDGYLVPPSVEQIDLKFPREGIDYDSLSDDEKAEWEAKDWGDDAQSGELPDRVNAAAINAWLFNADTVDKVLQHLMERGHRVAGGDRLAKTIIFARNHEHAKFIEQRFNHHYPHYHGHFARVIDNYAKYPESLLDDFSDPAKAPHIAISVDMLDTGIDVPEVANLVFFKPVYSRIKFWQMIGRGTRLCSELFGPEEDKTDFRVFDFCFNFDFFKENPGGTQAGNTVSVGESLFITKVELLSAVRAAGDHDSDGIISGGLIDSLHAEVQAMNPENFIVRMQGEAVEHFRSRASWDSLSASDLHVLKNKIAKLPSQIETDDVESRLFDLLAFRMQIAHVENDTALYERNRQRVVEIATALEEKRAIPAVQQQLAYLASLQDPAFWDGMTLELLEEVRTRLRGLVPFIDKKKRKIVYTNFKDEVMGIRTESLIDMPSMTGAQYEKKVKAYLNDHRDHLVIHRLRINKPLTETDLEGLEQSLIEIGEGNGETLLGDLLERSDAPSLAYFVKCMVGMDRAAAQSAFAKFLSDQSLSNSQMRFVEMIIDQLTARGVMEASALYEQPFNGLSGGGPEALFAGKDKVIEGLFDTLEQVRQVV